MADQPKNERNRRSDKLSCLHALPASHPVMFVRCTRKKAKEMSGNENADERMFVGQQILQGHAY